MDRVRRFTFFSALHFAVVVHFELCNLKFRYHLSLHHHRLDNLVEEEKADEDVDRREDQDEHWDQHFLCCQSNVRVNCINKIFILSKTTFKLSPTYELDFVHQWHP